MRQGEEVEQEVNDMLRYDLKNQYDMTRSLMKINQQLRQRLLLNTKMARAALKQALISKEKLVHKIEYTSKELASDVIPDKVFDFIKLEKNISRISALK